MLKLQDYLINKDEILYMEKYAFTEIKVIFKNGDVIRIEYDSEEERDSSFNDSSFNLVTLARFYRKEEL